MKIFEKPIDYRNKNVMLNWYLKPHNFLDLCLQQPLERFQQKPIGPSNFFIKLKIQIWNIFKFHGHCFFVVVIQSKAKLIPHF